MMSAASSGRLTSCRYRLTNRAIYFDEGLLSSNSQQVPLWAVRNVDVKQRMLQKARGIGDVIVHVEHSDYTGTNAVEIRAGVPSGTDGIQNRSQLMVAAAHHSIRRVSQDPAPVSPRRQGRPSCIRRT